MRVKVLFFGQLKEIVGRGEEQVELAEGASVRDLFARYHESHPRLAQFEPSVVASVNQEYAHWSDRLKANDEVAFLPPVSGGFGKLTTSGEDEIRLVRERIDSERIVASLKAPEDGAVVVFDGIVRNHSDWPRTNPERGVRSTLYLEYEAYEPMALRKMREIVAEMRQQFPIDRVAMVHRLGRLEIGETSVLIAVSSPHRRAAFDACRFGIDRMKKQVPIWKKEYFADGAVWVEGEHPEILPSTTSPTPRDR